MWKMQYKIERVQMEHVVGKKVEYIKSGAIVLVASYFKCIGQCVVCRGRVGEGGRGHVPQENL